MVDYQLQIGVLGVVNFDTGPFVINVGEITETQFQTAVPLLDGLYQWRVTARDAAQNTASSSPQFLNVDTLPPAPAPTLLSPGDGGSVGDLPFFEWTQSGAGVLDYLLQVTSGDSFNPHVDIEVIIAHPNTSHQATTPLAEAGYKWRVVARDDALNTAESLTQTFTVDITPPGVPVLISPLDNAFLDNKQVFFDWDAPSVDGVVDYQLQVVESADPFTVPFLVIDQLVTATEFTGDLNAQPDGVFKWRVLARDAALNTASSLTRTFTLDTVPPSPAPTLLFPEDGDSINEVTPFFEWTPSGAGVFDYLLQVTSGDTFNPHVDIEEVIAHPGTGHQATTPLAEAEYQWRVIARDRALNPASSLIQLFTVDITPPSPPTLLSPIGPTGDNTPLFDWDGNPADDSGYLLAVTSGDLDTAFLNLFGEAAGDPSEFDPFQFPPGEGPPGFDIFQPIAGDPITGVPPDSFFLVPPVDALADANYDWRVIATDRAFNTASSTTAAFRVDTQTDAPVLVAPKGIIGTQRPSFEWEHSDLSPNPPKDGV